jgi:hypothetical protein
MTPVPEPPSEAGAVGTAVALVAWVPSVARVVKYPVTRLDVFNRDHETRKVDEDGTQSTSASLTQELYAYADPYGTRVTGAVAARDVPPSTETGLTTVASRGGTALPLTSSLKTMTADGAIAVLPPIPTRRELFGYPEGVSIVTTGPATPAVVIVLALTWSGDPAASHPPMSPVPKGAVQSWLWYDNP